MVFVDESNGPKPKSGLGAANNAPAPPPAYGAHEGTSLTQGRPSGPPGQPYHYPTSHREPTSKRFVWALCVALLVWMLCGAFIRSLVWAVNWDHNHHGEGWSTYPVPPGVSLQNCRESGDWESDLSPRSLSSLAFTIAQAAWNKADDPNDDATAAGRMDPEVPNTPLQAYSFPYSSKTSFELPLSAETLYLLARGPYASGSVDIMTSSEQKEDSVGVHVTVNYYRKEIRDVVRVCEISRGPGDKGVGIFTPRDLHRHNPPGRGLYFETVIVLPELAKESWPLHIKDLETDVQNSVHRVYGIAEQVSFARLKLQGSNGAILTLSLDATTAVLKTSNSAISGSYNVSKELSIETSNGRVIAAASLYNDPTSPPTKLHIKTSNGAVEANVDLFAASKSKSRGLGGKRVSEKVNPQYDVDVRTSNGRLEVNYGKSPVNATLRFEGTTSNSPATASLHPAYQGTFKVQTSNSAAQLIEHSVPDPSGRGRTRKVVRNSVSKTGFSGSVEWVGDGDKDSTPKGTVSLTTSNSRAALVL